MTTTALNVKYNDNDQYNQDDYNNNNVVVLLRARAREGVGDFQEDGTREDLTEKYRIELDAFADYWRQITGNPLPPVGRRTIADYLDMQMEPELIAEIIDETSMAPRPSWAYAAAIFSRMLREKIFTLQAFRMSRYEHKYGSKRPY